MHMNFVQYQYYQFKNELDEFKEICNESKDLKNLKKIKKDIAVKEKLLNNEVANMPDEEIEFAVDDFMKYKNKQVMKYYHCLSAYFQRAYSIFESQVQYIQEFLRVENPKTPGEYIGFSKYPVINETNKLINVLKHRKGYSYNKLEEAGSKYLEKSELFEDSKHRFNSSMILNIEKNDIIKFLDEVQNVWSDKLEEYNLNRAQKSSSNNTCKVTDAKDESKDNKNDNTNKANTKIK